MPDFAVTEPMLRHIAIEAMGLTAGDARAYGAFSLRPVDDDVTLYTCERSWVFGPDSDGNDQDACDLLVWLVRHKKWVVNWLWANDERSCCAVQAHAPCDECRAVAPTLCEAIIKTILQATGWEGGE